MLPAQLLSATVVGDGPHTVIFGNGFATTQRAWDAIVPHVPASWRIVRFNYVGTTPESAPHWIPDRYRGFEGHVDDLCRLLAQLDVRNAVFVGHSMSGMIGALASVQAPERLAHLVMIGASACYADHDGYTGGATPEAITDTLRYLDADAAAWMAGFSGAIMGSDAREEQIQAFVACFAGMRRDISAALVRSLLRSDYRDMLADVAAETTIVQPADDVIVPVAAAEFLARQTRCTGLHILPIPGHLPHVTHPSLIAPIIRGVLQQRAGISPPTS